MAVNADAPQNAPAPQWQLLGWVYGLVSNPPPPVNVDAALNEPTLAKGVNQIQEGVGILYSVLRDRAYTLIVWSGAEEGVKKLHKMVVENRDLIFWAVALVNAWGHWMLFVGGATAGALMGSAGKRLNLITEPVQILKTKESIIAYDYLSIAFWIVLAPWLTSFQSGIVTGNYLVSNTPGTPGAAASAVPVKA